MRSSTKFGYNRFSRFDVYWIQTDRQTNGWNKLTDFFEETPPRGYLLHNSDFFKEFLNCHGQRRVLQLVNIFLSFTKTYWFFIFINYLIRFCLNLHYLRKEEMDFHSFTQFAHCEEVSSILDQETMENDQN